MSFTGLVSKSNSAVHASSVYHVVNVYAFLSGSAGLVAGFFAEFIGSFGTIELFENNLCGFSRYFNGRFFDEVIVGRKYLEHWLGEAKVGDFVGGNLADAWVFAV